MLYEERKCRECDMIEDEYHCLVECPRFESERRYCLNERLSKRETRSMFEFVKSLKSKNEEECKKLAILSYKVMREYKKVCE